MRRSHLSNVQQFLTSPRGAGIFSHFTANEDGEEDKKFFLLCQFLFFASRSHRPILENINLDSLCMLMCVCATHIWCGRAARYERRRLVCKCTADRRPGGLAFGWRPRLWQEVFMYLAALSPPVYTLEWPWITERTFSLRVNHEARTPPPSLILASRRRRPPATDVGGEFGKRLLARDEMFI